MPTLLTRTPPLGRSNWGTGVQPERRTTAQLNGVMPTTPARSLGAFTRASFSPKGNQLNPAYDESQDPVSVAPVRPYAPRPLSRTPLTRTPPQTDGLDGFALSNTLANAGIYQPVSFGASNAAANGTGYRPPQQTERANPLSGDNNYPTEGQTTRVQPAPFVQRGSSVPQGQDAMPGEDDTVAGSMAGTMKRMGGSSLFNRSFANPAAANTYTQYVRKMFP